MKNRMPLCLPETLVAIPSSFSWSEDHPPPGHWHSSELSPRTFCTFPRELSSRRLGRSHRPRGVERREETADDRFHADHGPPAATLRPPPSASRPTHRGRDRRHGPRSPSLDGAWLAGRGADGRGRSGCGGPHGAGAPTGGPEAAATRPEAHGAAPARAGPAPNLRVSPHRSASAGRTRQDADPARRGSGPRVSSRCERSCGSSVCRPVGSMPGAGGSARVRSTISRPVPAHRRLD